MGGDVDPAYALTGGLYTGSKKKQHDVTKQVEKESKQASAAQAAKVAEQEAAEKQRLAEATSEVEEKKARAKKAGGRSLLVKTSPRGIPTLGGN